MTSTAAAEWKPPGNPDPSAILNEARADTVAGRYSEALAKHVWFHSHALSYQRSLYGVRLSFALGYWMELASKYPPALKALRNIRDDAEVQIRHGKATRDIFHDLSSIDENLSEVTNIVDLFSWLDQNNPEFARMVYDIAQPALIDSKDYKLCGKYLSPTRSVDRMLELFREHLKMAKDRTVGGDITSFAQKSLTNSATTLVALLVLNDRVSEADQVVATVIKEWPDAKFREALAFARKGNVPEPWPRHGN